MSIAPLVTWAVIAVGAAGVMEAQSIEVTPETEKMSVGDPISLRVRVHLTERDALLDSVPRLGDPAPEGVRVLSFSGFSRGADRILTGTLRIALYRPGRQVIPSFSLRYRRNLVVPLATIASAPVGVDVVPVLPGAGASLKDLRDPERARSLGWLPLALAAAALAAAALLRRQRSRVARGAAPAPAAEPAPQPRTPLEIALDRLAAIERDGLASGGAVDRHYEEVGNVVRDYLEEAAAVRARERTTSELAWALPPHLSEGGMRGRCLDLLGEADLVKFARVRRTPADAARFTGAARALLERWSAAGAAGRAHALR